MSSRKVYAVANGLKKGLFDSYSECKAQVHKYPNALYMSFPTREQAMYWDANMAFLNETLRTPCYTVKTHYDDSVQMSVTQVLDLTSKKLYQQWFLPSPNAANVMEYAVIAHLLQEMHEKGELQSIYTTKTTIIYWIYHNHQNSSYLNSSACPDEIRHFVKEADAWLIDHYYRSFQPHYVGLWNEHEWGAIPFLRNHAATPA